MKEFNTVLNETNAYFEAQGMSILGEGYQDLATDSAKMTSYIDQLLEGVDNVNDQVNMRQLMENSNVVLLQESMISGITPIASLSMPVIRKMWPKIGLKDAIKTEVAKTPRFAVVHTRPYMEDASGNRTWLPHDGLMDGHDNSINNPALAPLVADVAGDVAGATGNAVTLGGAVGNSAKLVYTLAGNGGLEKVVVENIGGTDVFTKCDAISGTATQIAVGSDLYFISIDARAGEITVASTATLNGVVITIAVYESNEWNEAGYSVGFDTDRKDIVIGTGQHINAPLSVEFIQDTMALYNIDAMKEVVDTMTVHFAQMLDKEIAAYIATANAQGMALDYTWDARPDANYAGTPTSWREELKSVIDYAAIMVKQKTYFQNGSFAIVGNPIDIRLINEVQWQFRGSNAQSNGVDVNHSFGTWQGANTYNVVSSQNVTAGAIYLVFTPSVANQMSFKYYPYSFNMETSGYRDPNHGNVPSIMATKRHTIEDFIPAVAKIAISSNEASVTGQYRA